MHARTQKLFVTSNNVITMLLILVEECKNQACIAGKEKNPSLITKTYFRHVKTNQRNQRGILREQRSKKGRSWRFFCSKNKFIFHLAPKEMFKQRTFPAIICHIIYNHFLHIHFFAMVSTYLTTRERCGMYWSSLSYNIRRSNKSCGKY